MSMRVLIVTTCLGGGGAERHAVRLANAWGADDATEVVVGVIRGGGSYREFLDPHVDYVELAPAWASKRTLFACLSSIRPLRRLIESQRPDVLLSILQPATWTGQQACRSLPVHKVPLRIAAVQNHFQHQGIGRRAMWMQHRMAASVAKADHIVAISAGVAESIQQQFPATEGITSVIHNAAVDVGWEPPIEASDGGEPDSHLLSSASDAALRLVACGRLVEQKGFDLLLPAIRRVRERSPVHLTILGEGAERAKLEKMRAQLGLDAVVAMPGFVKDPLKTFCENDLFVLSSRWEGFGNVIVEAMSVGLPVVATDCHFGPSEIITPGVDGWLATKVESDELANTILKAIEHRSKWPEMARNARRRASDFKAETIASQYLRLFRELANRRRVESPQDENTGCD